MKGLVVNGIGKRIRQYREEAELTQEELAELAELSTNYLSAVEREVKSPTIDTLVKIMNAIKVTPNEVMQDVIIADTKDSMSQLEERIKRLSLKKQQKVLRILDFIIEEEEK